jgi:hypothetical protein
MKIAIGSESVRSLTGWQGSLDKGNKSDYTYAIFVS